jgi:periplasmic protein TonB
MTSSSALPPTHRAQALRAWLPSRRAIWWILGAFVAGLLLFAIALRGGKDEFYRAGPVAPTASEPDYAPLPAPIAGERGEGVSAAPAPREVAPGQERPRVVEAPKPPPAASTPSERRPGTPVATSQPQPISSPAPKYPSRALRRGDRGTVLIRAQVGVDGVPSDVTVSQTSGSRDLDRAAVEAVRRWRFRPAMSGELPVSASVNIPINFQP